MFLLLCLCLPQQRAADSRVISRHSTAPRKPLLLSHPPCVFRDRASLLVCNIRALSNLASTWTCSKATNPRHDGFAQRLSINSALSPQLSGVKPASYGGAQRLPYRTPGKATWRLVLSSDLMVQAATGTADQYDERLPFNTALDPRFVRSCQRHTMALG